MVNTINLLEDNVKDMIIWIRRLLNIYHNIKFKIYIKKSPEMLTGKV